MKYVIDFIYLLAALAVSPKVIYRAFRQHRYRRGWTQRLGDITRKEPYKNCIWIHAVSVGEVNATRTIVQRLKRKYKDYEIVISTTTDTGFDRAESLYGQDHVVFYFPLDLSFIMRKAFENIAPSICLLMELEVWPNFVDIAKSIDVPVVVVNGRITERSSGRYKLVKTVVEKMFSQIDLVLAQSEEYAARFRELGCHDKKIVVTGSLKYDTAQITDKIEGADKAAAELNIIDEKLWVAGGTGNDEEKNILEVYRQLQHGEKFRNLRLLIVPRKPERFNEVAYLIEHYGFDVVRYSNHKGKAPPRKSDSRTVILIDTMGDLRKFYSLATFIFVGRSLVNMGGSDMMEAAALGKCTMFGPYAFNFQQTVNALLRGKGAIQVKNANDLLQAMKRCFNDPGLAKKIARNGQRVIRSNQGATRKTIEQIDNILSRKSP